MPIVPASAPSAGPSSEPATAVPSAVPITCPRWSSGKLLMIQVSEPDQISAPATPWMKRAASSGQGESRRPKRKLAKPRPSSPTITVRRGPKRLATYPPGSDAASVPAA